MSTQKMFVVENGVTGEWIGWFPTEEQAFARLNYIVGGDESLKGHLIVRETVKTTYKA